MRRLNEKHPVIKQILDSECLADEDKLLALSELLRIRPVKTFDANSSTVVGLFVWTESELDHYFWSDVTDIIYLCHTIA